MSKSKNKPVREALEEEFGSKCMYHEGIRKIRPPAVSKRRYRGKKIQDQLTLHHLIPLRKNGPTTKENTAVLCRYCHDFVESLTEAEREKVNDELRAYKKRLDNIEIATVQMQNGKVVKSELLIPEEREEEICIPAYDISEEEWQKFKTERNKRVLESPKWEKGRKRVYEERD